MSSSSSSLIEGSKGWYLETAPSCGRNVATVDPVLTWIVLGVITCFLCILDSGCTHVLLSKIYKMRKCQSK